MATLKLHYDGWLALPADLRRKLGLTSGDRLEAELAQGAIVLRPAAKSRRPERQEEERAIEPPIADAAGAPAMPPPASTEAVPAKRKPGRPRKVADANDTPAPASAPRKVRGRPREAAALAPEPGPVALPVVGVGPAKLRKKADLPPEAPPVDQAAPPAAAIGRTTDDAGSQPEERRPFRNVEVRKLGPGRGRTRPRGFHP